MGRPRKRLFVISSPSGGGKTSIVKELKKEGFDFAYSISATTRLPRKDEKDGVDYIFLDEKTFLKWIKEGAFLEWAKVHGYYYGTLKTQIDRYLSQGKRVLLDIDVQGGLRLKNTRPDAVLIFLSPPGIEALKKRLKKRGTESSEAIEKRLHVAKKELQMADQYDFQVINDKLKDTVKEVKAIIQACDNSY